MSDNDFDRFVLTSEERDSQLWLRFMAHCNKRLAELRATNDKPLPQDQTQALRGRIACLKEFISLGKEPPLIDG